MSYSNPSLAKREAELLRKDAELQKKNAKIVAQVNRTLKGTQETVQRLNDKPVIDTISAISEGFSGFGDKVDDAGTSKPRSARGGKKSPKDTTGRLRKSSSKGRGSPRSGKRTPRSGKRNSSTKAGSAKKGSVEVVKSNASATKGGAAAAGEAAAASPAPLTAPAAKSASKQPGNVTSAEDASANEIKGLLGNIQGDSWTSDPVALEEMGIEAMIRYQKARISALEHREKQVLADRADMESRLQQAMQKLSLQNDENRKLQRSYSKLQGELEKQKKATHGMRLNADRAQAQLEAVRKDLERAKRNTSQRESEVTHKDVRLTRAIEEIDRLKSLLTETRRNAKEDASQARSREEAFTRDVKRLEKQKAELLSAFKKQLKLIDVLKRQRVHLEAAKMLSFTEKEFAQTLEYGM